MQFKKISDDQTHETRFYTELLNIKEEDGTTHVSILDDNGDAVSSTSSINFK